MIRVFRFALVALAFVAVAPAWAQPAVTIDIVAEREIADADNGAVRRVPAENIGPGAEVIYTVHYTNSGTETATDVVIENPIPTPVAYIPESATPDAGPVTFSIDNGRTFGPPEALTLEVELPDGRKIEQPAPPERYTHVRWTIASIEPGNRGDVAYRVRVR